MITVNLYYTGENGSAHKFAEEMESSGIVDKIRAEEGNVRYEYFFPMKDPETVLLIDAWEDQEAIDKHHASPMMKTISPKIAASSWLKTSKTSVPICFQTRLLL